jgi:hydrophobe/amphiphile efflux-3 (HAE3) family protein
LQNFLKFPIRHPWFVCAGIFAATVLALTSIIDIPNGGTRLRIDPSFDAILPDDDPARLYYDHVKDLFGDDQSLIIAMVTDDVFTVENLARVAKISDLLEDADGVDHVLSLATANNIRDVEGSVEIEPFLEEMPETQEDAERLRAEVQSNPVYGGNIASLDSRVAAFVVFTDDTPEQQFTADQLDRKMFDIVSEHAGGAEVLISGTASMRSEISRILRGDMSAMLPGVALIMAILAYVSFRSVRGVVVPMATILLAIVWTFGVVAWADVPLNLVTTILPVLLLTVGFAYSVHIVSAYYEALREDASEVEAAGGAAGWALAHVGSPVFLTVLTTAVGFLSLALSPFPAVRHFGLISVFGVCATAVISLTFGPAVLSLLRVPEDTGEGTSTNDNRIDAFVARWSQWVLAARKPILVAGGLIVVLSLWGLSQIVIDTHLITNFDKDHPVRANFDGISDHLEGARPFSIVLESQDYDAFLDSDNLKAVANLQKWVEGQPEVGGATSFADYVSLLNRAFHEDDPAELKIPENSSLISQLMLVFGGNDDLPNFTTSDYSTVHIHVRSNAETTLEIAALVERIEERFVKLPEGIQGGVTGSTVVLAQSINAIAGGQVQSLSIAMLFIFLLLSLLFASFRVGFFALLPNLLPILLFFGVLGLTGVALNATTGLIACVVLGIAVDDTIHFLVRFNVCARREADEREGAIIALREVIRPVTTTSVALFLGFLVFTTGVLRNQTEFGALAAVILAFAWFVDITFTPALCSGLRVVTLWDALTFDLGDQPQEAIPAFKGLTKSQARIAALMTSVVSHKAGEQVLEEGTVGRELYVVIDGELLVSLKGADGSPVDLAYMKRGDVIGEVGLYYGQRTADVTATSDCRLLRLDHENLDRLHRRYPRIGRKLAWNLSAIMAERLARATARENTRASGRPVVSPPQGSTPFAV